MPIQRTRTAAWTRQGWRAELVLGTTLSGWAPPWQYLANMNMGLNIVSVGLRTDSEVAANTTYGSSGFGPGYTDSAAGSGGTLNMNFSAGAAMLAGLGASGIDGTSPGDLADADVLNYVIPSTIDQVGYVPPPLSKSSPYGSDLSGNSPYASIEYQIKDLTGAPLMAGPTVSEVLVQLDGNVIPSEPSQWGIEPGGYTFDELGFRINAGSSCYNVTWQQFYVIMNATPFSSGLTFFLTPTYTQSASYQNGILQAQATRNP